MENFFSAASQSAQEAYKLKEDDHSLFTYYLLKGLSGDKKSVNSEGNITPHSLGGYVYKSILNLPARKRPKQKPITKGEASGEIILASSRDLASSKKFDWISKAPYKPSPFTPSPPPMMQQTPPTTNPSTQDEISSSPALQEGEGKKEQHYPKEVVPTVKEKQKPWISPKILAPILAVVVIGAILVFFYFNGAFGPSTTQIANQSLPPPPGTTTTNQPPTALNQSVTTRANQPINIANQSLPPPPGTTTTNQPPTALNQSVTTRANQPINIALGATDQDNDNLEASIVLGPLHGRLGKIDQNTGNVTYTPYAVFVGTDSFTFRANDGKVDSGNLGTVEITVNNSFPSPQPLTPGTTSINTTNQPPTALNQSVTTRANQPINIALGATDQDNDNLEASIVLGPLHGRLGKIDQNTGNVTYTPYAVFVGTDSFTFRANDGKVDSGNLGTVEIAVQ